MTSVCVWVAVVLGQVGGSWSRVWEGGVVLYMFVL